MHHNKNESFFARAFGVPEAAYLSTQKMLQAMAVTTKDSLDGRDITTFNVVCPSKSSSIHHEARAGTFFTPSVQELRAEVAELRSKLPRDAARTGPRVVLDHVVGESYSQHMDPSYSGAVMQAASQFNCLEMINPGVTPDRGISCYESDRTQGPACARACPYGTAERNFLTTAHGGNEPGQSSRHQVYCLHDVEAFLIEKSGLKGSAFQVSNGYIESSDRTLNAINERCLADPASEEEVMKRLRVGVQRDTQVMSNVDIRTLKSPLAPHLVTQVYASAIPVGYSKCKPTHWAPLAQVVLKATYEATLLTGVLAQIRRLLLKAGSSVGATDGATPPIVLTSVGGGVFRNDADWIYAAINHAVNLVAALDLPFTVVVHYSHFGKISETAQRAVVAGVA